MTAAERHPDPHAEAASQGFEARDVPPRPAALALVGLIGLLALGLLFGAATTALLQPAPRHIEPTAAPLESPSPRLQVSPVDDRMALEAAARQKLQGYAWVDKKGQRVRLPIARALQVMAERGWPDQWKKSAP